MKKRGQAEEIWRRFECGNGIREIPVLIHNKVYKGEAEKLPKKATTKIQIYRSPGVCERRCLTRLFVRFDRVEVTDIEFDVSPAVVILSTWDSMRRCTLDYPACGAFSLRKSLAAACLKRLWNESFEAKNTISAGGATCRQTVETNVFYARYRTRNDMAPLFLLPSLVLIVRLNSFMNETRTSVRPLR